MCCPGHGCWHSGLLLREPFLQNQNILTKCSARLPCNGKNKLRMRDAEINSIVLLNSKELLKQNNNLEKWERTVHFSIHLTWFHQCNMALLHKEYWLFLLFSHNDGDKRAAWGHQECLPSPMIQKAQFQTHVKPLRGH